MDRRTFFKTMLTTSLTAPWFLAAKKSSTAVELYLISDTPEEILPRLLLGLNQLGFFQGKNFALSQAHPRQEALTLTLKAQGWRLSSPEKAELRVGFGLLHAAARPSFTLIQDGRIRDLRSASLYSLWKQMQSLPPVRVLTTLTANARFPSPEPGQTVAVRVRGQVVERLPLARNIRRTIDTGSGRISFFVENGHVRVADSTCRHQVCVASAAISSAGERIICAPNQFIVEVEGRRWVDTIIG